MKNLYILFIVFAFFLVLTSCNDFLDNPPPSSIPEEQVFNTMEDCEAALNGAYKSMYNYIVTFPALYDVITDDIKYTKWGDGSYAGTRRFNYHSASFGTSDSPWNMHYMQIARVNNLLEGIEKFGDNADTRRIKSEAYMFRAMAHFELLRTYGHRYNKETAATDKGVPYVFKTTLDAKPRESIKQNLGNILADLKLSRDLINAKATKNVYRLSLDAWFAFQTRVGLYMEDYERVTNYADSLKTKYELTANQEDLNAFWLKDNIANNKETIFMIGLSQAEANAGFSISEIIYLRDKDTKGQARPNFLPASELISIYDKSNDLRWNAYFTENYPTLSGITISNEKLTVVTKYLGNPDLANTYKINQTKYFRYAEVVLNRIEALYHTDQAKALEELNAFRAKRILNYTDQNYAGQTLLNQIKLERRKEFAFEGFRFHDLRRWNDGFNRTLDKYTAITEAITVSPTDHHWCWPIPQHEINANKLPAEYQNPGY